MDTLRGQFDPAAFSEIGEELPDFDFAEEEDTLEPPPSPVGQDERRMQVRAYNHWASQLGDRNYPAIEDLDAENQVDFGPYSVLLDFTNGIEDPAVRFVGNELAAECDATEGIAQLSDVPARSLLSRITDHYMQILANQAPIGFEAEFVNQRGTTILYRGILLPYSSDNDTIDFIYGVINWKELADQQTTDELMLEIDQALEAGEVSGPADEDDNILDLSSFGAAEPEAEAPAQPPEERMPRPSFGSLLTPENFDYDDDEEEDDFGLPAGWSLSDPNEPDDGEYADDSADVYDDDYDPETAEEEEDDGVELGLARLIEDEFERSQRRPIDIDMLDIAEDAIDPEATSANAHEIAQEELFADHEEPVAEEPQAFEAVEEIPAEEPVEPVAEEEIFAEDEFEDEFELEAPVENVEAVEEIETSEFDLDEPEAEAEVTEEPVVETPADEITPEPAPQIELAAFAAVDLAGDDEDLEVSLEPADDSYGLYDSLADARELAQTARASEDRSRTALYAAVGRAYDVSLAASEAPEDYAELLEENGLTQQDRAPMTPVVKLVFGADYDKTRLTEYAAVLTHAHRVGIERGKLGTFLAEAEGGLKAVVQTERQLRREEAGKPVEDKSCVRAKLAEKLRAIEPQSFDDIDPKGAEFALVMVRRTPEGELVVLGEIGDDIPLIERAARKLTA